MRLAPFLLYGALVWVAAIAAAPALASSNSPAAVVVGLVIYRAASVVCHQIPERSFQLSALPLAVCARCLGLYAGAGTASIAALSVGFRVQHPGSRLGPLALVPAAWTRLALASIPTAATWVLERAGWWASSNAVRFATALPLGFAAAWIVLAALRAEEPIQ